MRTSAPCFIAGTDGGEGASHRCTDRVCRGECAACCTAAGAQSFKGGVEVLEASIQQGHKEQPLLRPSGEVQAELTLGQGGIDEGCGEQPPPFPSENVPQGSGAPVVHDAGMMRALLLQSC